MIGKSKRPKYGNKRVEYEGIKFDSEREKSRYIFLKDAENRGIISNLEVHIRFELIPAVKETYRVKLKTKTIKKQRTLQRSITYTCDFKYIQNKKVVVEDVKISEFMLPKEYILKEKMLFALKGIKVKRVYKPTESITE